MFGLQLSRYRSLHSLMHHSFQINTSSMDTEEVQERIHEMLHQQAMPLCYWLAD